MKRMIVPAAAAASAAAVAALSFAAQGDAAVRRLVATVGPDETIALRTAGGAPVRALRSGTYVIVVHDRSAEHNFHLVGPGVNKATGVAKTGTVRWRVTFRRGKVYRFVCDPHADDMRGSLRAR